MTSASLSSTASTPQPNFSLTTSQTTAVDHCLRYDSTLLIAAKGFGKTRTGLAVAWESGGNVLILAPNKVRQGWVTEGRRVGIDVTLIEGPADARKRLLARGGIMVMGVDLIKWLGAEYRRPPFHAMILDETTRYSKPGAVGVRVLRRFRQHLDWVLGMTASPVMEDPLALYGQALVIDGGAALGRSFDAYKARYFYPEDYMGYSWKLRPGGAQALAQDTSSLIYVADDTQYEESLVPLTEETIEVAGTARFWEHYEAMCEEAWVEVGNGVEAVNEAVVSAKLEQLTQGFIYDDNGDAHYIHDRKMFALEELMLTIDEPVVIVYCFKEELARLREALPEGRDLRDDGALEDFNAGKLDVLFMHPRSGSHGINLQERCSEMICLKPFWSADGWDQVVGRIRRRGQTKACRRRTLIIPGTVDEVIIERVLGKEQVATSVLDHIKAHA